MREVGTAGSEFLALKPMNCPEAMLIFGLKRRGYRELPMRLAEQSVLHRNEKAVGYAQEVYEISPPNSCRSRLDVRDDETGAKIRDGNWRRPLTYR